MVFYKIAFDVNITETVFIKLSLMQVIFNYFIHTALDSAMRSLSATS